MHIHLNHLLSQNRNLHILYQYSDEEEYKRQSLTYIAEGIAAGEQIIFIENERFTSLLQRELRSRLSKEELDAIHFINSLYFYQSSGSYKPSAIKQYYMEIVCPYLHNDILFRSWAHVEWSSVGEPYHLIPGL
ncbi:hypothetical protein OXB_2385 [Bacillus sp. OxB-1]|uniref:MEDS domain-containing protein n=1 Tax=Bacillus sp. (strain OxB-1) TaxID=98228 RepID=UPI000581ED15|nr:MEDS domain-containing protein [Bacillus sp. OxB-1]BAQ10856.1 hypothetical protein OXB_2385 [Bacillus sp. OxB-1]